MTESGFDKALYPVPENERRGTVTMGLFWLTMITSYASVLIGFEWHRRGITLPELVGCALLSCSFVFIYAIPACLLGARTGLTYAILSRQIFGVRPAQILTGLLVLKYIAYYGLGALFLTEGLSGLYPLPIEKPLLAAIFAMLMSLNTLFGFRGVATFACFWAAPALIIWVLLSLAKVVAITPLAVLSYVPTRHESLPLTFQTIASFVFLFTARGNEPDYWRFSKAKISAIAWPLLAAVIIGQIVFPATGWLVAQATGIHDYAGATAMLNKFSFGSANYLAAAVLIAVYFGGCDCNLFGSLTTCQSFAKLPRQVWVLLLAVAGATAAAWQAVYGVQKSFEAITAIVTIVLPLPTVLVLVEQIFLSKVAGSPVFDLAVPMAQNRPTGVIAFLGGVLTGIASSNLIPVTQFMHLGLCSVNAWLAGILIYVPLRLIEGARLVKEQKSGTMVELGAIREPFLPH